MRAALVAGALLLSLSTGCHTTTPAPSPSASKGDVPVLSLTLDGKLDDSGPRHLTARAVGNVTFAPGRKGSAAVIGGPGNYIEVDLGKQLDLSQGATVELWFKSDGWVNPDKDNVTQALVASEPFGLTVNSQGALEATEKLVDGSTLNLTSDVRQVTPNKWHHAALVADPVGRQTVTLYLDGKKQQENANIKTAPQGTLLGPLRLGSADPRRWPFKGQISDVRLYDRPMDASEIAQAAR